MDGLFQENLIILKKGKALKPMYKVEDIYSSVRLSKPNSKKMFGDIIKKDLELIYLPLELCLLG